MKFRKKFSIATVSLLTLAALAACSNGTKSTSTTEKTGTITMWAAFSGPDLKNFQDTIDKYNATKPDFTLKLIPMKADTLKSKLTTAGKAGTGLPDVAELASEQLPYYKDLGLLDSWDTMIKDSDLKASNYVPATWQIGTLSGKQYGIPDTMGTWVMYYNKALVEKYAPHALDDGIVTYQEVEAAAPAAKADGVYATSNDWGSQNFMNIYLQMGGKWRDSNGKFNIDNKTAQAAWAEWKKLNDNGYIVPNGQDATKAFMSGKVIFNPEGTWMLNTYQGIKGFDWGEMMTLQYDSSNVIQCSGAGQFAIFKEKATRSSGREQGMVKFLSWLQSNQLQIVQSGANPSSLAMLDNADYKKLPQSFLISDPVAQKALKINTDAGISPFMTEFDAKNWDMLTGKADIPTTLNQIQQTIDAQMGN